MPSSSPERRPSMLNFVVGKSAGRSTPSPFTVLPNKSKKFLFLSEFSREIDALEAEELDLDATLSDLEYVLDFVEKSED